MRLTSLFSGLLFGLGLAVSGMVQPQKVQGFLDLAGVWDPSLALVMVAAIGVFLPGYLLLIKPRRQSLSGQPFHLSNKVGIEPVLLLGAALFGIGWGLVGVCPGPALALLASGQASAVGFVLAMLAGIKLGCWIQEWQLRRLTSAG